MKRIILLISVMGLATVNSHAQEDSDEGKNDRIRSFKIAFITEKLDLTSAEAKEFWPVYNEFNNQTKRIKAKEKENVKMMQAQASISDQEADKFIADQLSLKQQYIDLTKRYIIEFKKVLSAKKVAKLLMLEQEFKQELLRRVEERKLRK